MICTTVSIFYVLFKTWPVHMTARATSEVWPGHFLILDVHWPLAGRYFELSLQHD